MLSDEQLIDLMVHEPSWEDVIVKIVAEEGMDPWNIDLIQLADTFSGYLTRMEQTDLRVPARFILIAAILLRMKSDILVAKKRKDLIPESEKPLSPMLQALAKVPPLEPPIKRMPLANVSIDELMTALKKAFAPCYRSSGSPFLLPCALACPLLSASDWAACWARSPSAFPSGWSPSGSLRAWRSLPSSRFPCSSSPES